MQRAFHQQEIALSSEDLSRLRAEALHQRVGVGLLGRVMVRFTLDRTDDPDYERLIADEADAEQARRRAATQVNLAKARAARAGRKKKA
ncbi:hypothetical protein [Acidipropionibacterium acidipropionici]|uniref:hypothetical protein n=1 Tax=Acidipropionibacterium acidipropionici TaxID=1748 RepID=UPI00042A8941|nr:hypothetical protein [Acidipropionibacterium acidipropionici]ALN14352.1 hypothetical protein ASQ49_02675 [Acidipropionibacterium acidipropionici]APZ09885.1 hypothetical protein BWX38_12275 [Acidipropionibacterium acidipropionici]